MEYIRRLTFSVAFCPRLSFSKKAVPVSGSAISRAWITTDIFKQSTVYCTSKVVQANTLARRTIIAPLLAQRPGVIKVSKVSSFWSQTCSADELVSWYFGPGSLNDKENKHISVTKKISWAQKSAGPGGYKWGRYTLFFIRIEAEYSYFSADVRLKIFLWMFLD